LRGLGKELVELGRVDLRRQEAVMLADPPAPSLSLEITTKRLVLRPPHPADVPAVRRLLRRNAEHLRPWSPVPRSGEDPSSLTEISKSILRQRREWSKSEAYIFFMVAGETEPTGTVLGPPVGALLGRIALTGVMRGAFMSSHLGYWIDSEYQSCGYTSEAVHGVVSFAFRTLGLHRVQAAVMPRNAASQRVLAKLGFRREGEAARYLQIAGLWEDHYLFAVTAEEWPANP
jgi:[ribosomal protein S5]-alanine N-acetyltransferase